MENVRSVADAFNLQYLAAASIAMFVLIGLRYTYRAFLHRVLYSKPLSDPIMQEMLDTLPPERAAWKAFGAFVVACVLAWVYYQ